MLDTPHQYQALINAVTVEVKSNAATRPICYAVKRNGIQVDICLCFLLIIGATGRVNDFWSGRRGNGKIVADLKSPSARLAFSGAGAVFLTIAIFLAIHLLSELHGTSHH
jgi:hypothetical protein